MQSSLLDYANLIIIIVTPHCFGVFIFRLHKTDDVISTIRLIRLIRHISPISLISPINPISHISSISLISLISPISPIGLISPINNQDIISRPAICRLLPPERRHIAA